MAMITKNPSLKTALNSTQSTYAGYSGLIVDLSAAPNSINGVPEWVQLLNNDERVIGRDGRKWINDDPEAIVAVFNANLLTGLKLVFDWEHATVHKGPKGDPAPAAAWGTEIEIRNDREIWVKLDWTDTGRWAVQTKEYRYLSPVLLYIGKTLQIRGIKSVGLTNSPNLTIAALNHAKHNQPKEDYSMTLLQAMCQSLGLPDGSTEAAVIAKASALQEQLATATNAAKNPSLDQFVPKADYDQAMATATNAQQALATIKEEALAGEIKTAINAALKDKKISPASVEYHTANCQEEGGLKRFADFVKTAVPVLGDQSELDDKKPGDDNGVALNAEQQQIADAFGNSADDLKTHGG